MTKPETIAQLNRKIERLEAQLAEMKARADKCELSFVCAFCCGEEPDKRQRGNATQRNR